MKKRLIISACLLGAATRYDGKSVEVLDKAVLDSLSEKYELVPVCPEVRGGLPTPRTPSERVGDRVIMRDGVDVTQEFSRGATQCLALSLDCVASAALLKERSPSCGVNEIYDGSFTGRKIKGKGVFSEMLCENGIAVFSENEVLELLE